MAMDWKRAEAAKKALAARYGSDMRTAMTALSQVMKHFQRDIPGYYK